MIHRRFGFFLSLAALLVVSERPSLAAEAAPATYKGWKTLQLSNGLVSVEVAPQIGGRVIQLSLGDFEFFWVNEQLAGKTPPPSRLDPDGKWLNYGGEKVWPAPQGWDNDRQWPGPPDPVLDGGPYQGTIVAKTGYPVAVKVVSEKDKQSGIQFSRVFKVFDDSSRVRVEATMTNIDTKPRRWGIWSVVQQNTADASGAGYNRRMRVYCPINPKSIYPKGYEVMFGLARNLQFQPNAARDMMVVHYQRRVGKIGMDSSAGWVATVNGASGYVFVQRFPYFPDREYPDNASMEVWTHGPGKCVIAGEMVDMAEDPAETPYLLETEILSPLAHLEPGESYSFAHDWFAARIGGDFPIVDCTEVGVTCEPFSVRLAGGKLTLGGRFGVFYRGTTGLAFYDAAGKRIGLAVGKRPVTPAEPLVLSGEAKVSVPSGAAKVALTVHDASGRELGVLSQTSLPAGR